MSGACGRSGGGRGRAGVRRKPVRLEQSAGLKAIHGRAKFGAVHSFPHSLLSALIITTLWARQAGAATLVDDGFEVATHPTGLRTVAAGTGGVFYTRDSAAAVSATIGADATFGSNGLTVMDLSGGAASKPVIGLLPFAVSLNNPGDFLTLSFNFHFINSGAATDSGGGFRFGFHNSTGTPVTADNQTAVSDNDVGYYTQVAETAAGPDTSNTLFRENGGTAPILAGTDRLAVTSNLAGFSISDNNSHAAIFTVTRTNATTMTISTNIDSGTARTGTTTTNIVTTFDEFSFSNGFATTALNYALDNVQVTSNVPEPTSGGLLVMGLAGLTLRRRR